MIEKPVMAMHDAQLANLTDVELLRLRDELLLRGPVKAGAVPLSLSGGVESTKRFRAAEKITHAIARHVPDADWLAVVREGTIPDPLPLSPRELEEARGAGFWAAFGSYLAFCATDPTFNLLEGMNLLPILLVDVAVEAYDQSW